MDIHKKNTGINELDINRWTLFFNTKRIEKKYRDEYFEKSITPFRISFIILIALYSLFGLLDLFTSEQFLFEFYIIRYGIVVPLLLCVWILSFLRPFKKIWQALISFCYVVGGSGIVLMLLMNPTNIYYYGGIFLIFIAGYFFINLHFLWAILSGIIITIFYSIAPLITDSLPHSSLEHILISVTFFISANIIAAVALYNNQFTERSEFYQRMLLSAQQDKIKRINEGLEEKVEERTELLKTRNESLNQEIENRIRIEEKLIFAKQKAEESDRLKSAFLSNMSHEIRTPMNGILGFLDIITEPDISKNEREQFLGFVKLSAHRLLQTINDIVEISKIEAGELSKNISPINLGETFKYIHNFFSIEAADKNIKLNFPELQEEFVIKTDGNKLESIFLNLVKNALKFTDKGSIEVGYKISGGKLDFYVKDTGKGIHEERQTAIFDRFVQADLGLTKGHEGTGLGLSICKAYVECLGGKMWLKSAPDEGSTFYFSIEYQPISSISSRSTKQIFSPAQNSLQEKVTILVAEDDAMSFNLINTILQNEQINVIHAKNGKEAVQQFISAANSISLILMDIKMPVMDGIKATQEIRRLDEQVPIIAQTAFALSGENEIAMQAGCDYYLPKPVKRNDLLAAIKKFSPKST